MAPSTQRWSTPLLLLPAVCGLLWLPLAATAQINSPSNAGGNSGNNNSGSSGSPLSTPSFSTVQPVSTVPGVTVDADGTITAAPQVQLVANTAVAAAASTPAGAPLVELVGAPPAAVSATELVNPNQTPEISLASGAGQSTQTFLTLTQQFSADSVGSTFTITNLRTANSGTVALAPDALVVTVAGTQVSVATTAQNQVALAQFAAVGIAAGLTPQAIAAGLQIVAAGAAPIQVAQLMVSLQGLASATTLTPLSNGINAFNAILNSTPNAGLDALASNGAFLAARSLLIAGRDSLGA